jgi:hypothetical protein
MTTVSKRGRPKGTGINDRETLLKIAHLIAGNPNMKRTTAIKQVGITNPSVVRRLRDKYQEQEHSLLAEVAATTARTRPAAEASAKAEPAKKAKPGTAGSPSAAQLGSQPPSGAGAKPGQPVDLLAALLGGVSIESLVSDFIGQVLGIESKQADQSPITALIRQQAHLVDLVLPLLISQFGNQKTAARAA